MVSAMASDALSRPPDALTEPSVDGLTAAEREHFVRRGYVVLRGAVAKERVNEWRELARSRARRDPGKYVPECKTARQRRALEEFEYGRAVRHFGGRISVFGDRLMPIREVSPRAWAAACQLAGSADSWERDFWGDYTILGNPMRTLVLNQRMVRKGLKWHVDDPRPDATATNTRVGLVPLILLSDIGPKEGATLLAAGSVRMIADVLRKASGPVDLDARDLCGPIYDRCEDVVEATGEAGDVYLTHPYALHTAAPQTQRTVRVLANPIMYLKEPLDLTKTSGLSILEQACLPESR